MASLGYCDESFDILAGCSDQDLLDFVYNLDLRTLEEIYTTDEVVYLGKEFYKQTFQYRYLHVWRDSGFQINSKEYKALNKMYEDISLELNIKILNYIDC